MSDHIRAPPIQHTSYRQDVLDPFQDYNHLYDSPEHLTRETKRAAEPKMSVTPLEHDPLADAKFEEST